MSKRKAEIANDNDTPEVRPGTVAARATLSLMGDGVVVNFVKREVSRAVRASTKYAKEGDSISRDALLTLAVSRASEAGYKLTASQLRKIVADALK